jgi:hypothetical protein
VRSFGWVTRSRLALVFRDDPEARLTWWAVLAIMALGVVGGLLRTGLPATLDSAWAEDGRDFLSTSLRDGPVLSLLEPYAGYGHLLPRLLSGLASVGPLSASSAVMAVAAVSVVGLLALLVFRASAGHIQNVWVRFVLAAFVALQPVATEVLVSLANLQWYLLFAAFVVLVWSGTSTSATVVGAVVCFLAAASSPFGALLLLFAVLRILVLRTGRSWISPVALASGALVQTWVMLHSPERGLEPMTSPFRLAAWYVGHVLAPVLFGERLTGDDLTARSLAMGLVALGVCVVLFCMASKRARTEMTPILVCTGVFSVVFYLAPTVVGGISAPRYGVPAALGLAFGIAVMAAQIIRDRVALASTGAAESGRTARTGRAARVPVLLGILVVMLIGWTVALPSARPAGPSWSAGVESEGSGCQAGSTESVVVPISPAGWTARIPCAKVAALRER